MRKAASWMLKQAQARDDTEAELLDPPLPFFDEKGPFISMTSENAEALRWQETLGQHNGSIFVVAEYNPSITGVLKNVPEQAHHDWGRKPFTAIGYGGNGAARAVEQLSLLAMPLRMVSTAASVHVGGIEFRSTSPMGENKPIENIKACLLSATTSALHKLVCWARVAMAAKAVEAFN